MPVTITIEVCSRSSVATEFPCNCEDSVQSENPKAALYWSLSQHRPAQGNDPLWHWCVLGWSTSKRTLTSMALSCQGPNQHLWILQGHVSGCSCVQEPALILHVFFFHTKPLFSLTIAFLVSLQAIDKSSSHFPLFVLLYTEILLTLALFTHRERQCGTKRPSKLWESLSKLLSRLWTHQVSEDNKTLSVWCLDRSGMRSCVMEAFDFISGSLLGSQLSLFYSPATPTSDFILKLSYFAHAGLLWLGRGPVYTNIHSTSLFFLGDLPVVSEISQPLSWKTYQKPFEDGKCNGLIPPPDSSADIALQWNRLLSDQWSSLPMFLFCKHNLGPFFELRVTAHVCSRPSPAGSFCPAESSHTYGDHSHSEIQTSALMKILSWFLVGNKSSPKLFVLAQWPFFPPKCSLKPEAPPVFRRVLEAARKCSVCPESNRKTDQTVLKRLTKTSWWGMKALVSHTPQWAKK